MRRGGSSCPQSTPERNGGSQRVGASSEGSPRSRLLAEIYVPARLRAKPRGVTHHTRARACARAHRRAPRTAGEIPGPLGNRHGTGRPPLTRSRRRRAALAGLGRVHPAPPLQGSGWWVRVWSRTNRRKEGNSHGRGMWSGPDASLSAACGIHPRIPPLTHSCTPFPVPALCGTAPETGVQVNKPRLLTVRKATYQV